MPPHKPDQRQESVRKLKRLLATYDTTTLSPLDCLILEHLADVGGDSQVGVGRMLADAGVSLTPGNISRHMARLYQKGHVLWGPGPDGRTKHVVATASGRAAATAQDKVLRAVFSLEENARHASAVVVECPSCKTQLRLGNHGPKVRATCPKCRQRFRVLFESGECILVLEGVTTREESPTQPAHEVLGVSRTASKDQVSEARRAQLRKYHPDLFHALGADFVALATKRSQAINHAYDSMVGH